MDLKFNDILVNYLVISVIRLLGYYVVFFGFFWMFMAWDPRKGPKPTVGASNRGTKRPKFIVTHIL